MASRALPRAVACPIFSLSFAFRDISVTILEFGNAEAITSTIDERSRGRRKLKAEDGRLIKI